MKSPPPPPLPCFKRGCAAISHQLSLPEKKKTFPNHIDCTSASTQLCFIPTTHTIPQIITYIYISKPPQSINPQLRAGPTTTLLQPKKNPPTHIHPELSRDREIYILIPAFHLNRESVPNDNLPNPNQKNFWGHGDFMEKCPGGPGGGGGLGGYYIYSEPHAFCKSESLRTRTSTSGGAPFPGFSPHTASYLLSNLPPIFSRGSV